MISDDVELACAGPREPPSGLEAEGQAEGQVEGQAESQAGGQAEGQAEVEHRRPRFDSSDEFFEWLRDHLVEEGQLTGAEKETCELLLLGRNYVEIAAARHVSLETIKWHVKRILRKLGIGSTRELLWVIGYRIDRQH
ncbi:MAG: helix-turn-helix transcriptional regulator [Myxococcota bacterium]